MSPQPCASYEWNSFTQMISLLVQITQYWIYFPSESARVFCPVLSPTSLTPLTPPDLSILQWNETNWRQKLSIYAVVSTFTVQVCR